MNNKIDLISFLASLEEKYSDINFYDIRLTSKVRRLFNIEKQYMKKVKQKGFIYPRIMEYKKVPSVRGKSLIIKFKKQDSSIKIKTLIEVLKENNKDYEKQYVENNNIIIVI